MKNFIKENWFKLFLIIIIGASILYYFFILVPKKEEVIISQKLIENQIKCKKTADEFTIKNVDTSTPYGAIYSEPQYIFSNDLNTCLYRKEYSVYWSDGVHLADDYSIIDIYSNRVVARLFKHYDLKGNVNNSTGDETEYYNFINKYFSE